MSRVALHKHGEELFRSISNACKNAPFRNTSGLPGTHGHRRHGASLMFLMFCSQMSTTTPTTSEALSTTDNDLSNAVSDLGANTIRKSERLTDDGRSVGLPLVLFPGLAADERVFKPQKELLGDQLYVPKWLDPYPDESLPSYASRMANHIYFENEEFREKLAHHKRICVGGVSFGGMVALEVARSIVNSLADMQQQQQQQRHDGEENNSGESNTLPQVHAKVFLISSTYSHEGVPLWLKMLERTGRLVPNEAWDVATNLLPSISKFNGKINEDDHHRLLMEMRASMNVSFIRWACKAIMKWKYFQKDDDEEDNNKKLASSGNDTDQRTQKQSADDYIQIYHIHGNRDVIIPHREDPENKRRIYKQLLKSYVVANAADAYTKSFLLKIKQWGANTKQEEQEQQQQQQQQQTILSNIINPRRGATVSFLLNNKQKTTTTTTATTKTASTSDQTTTTSTTTTTTENKQQHKYAHMERSRILKVVEGGGHLLTLTHAKEVNQFLLENIKFDTEDPATAADRRHHKQ